MIKIFFIVFALVILPSSIYSGCFSGCPCITDDICEYFCNGTQCQYSLPLWSRCSGYYTHQRECGTGAYCDPNMLTCQLKKTSGEYCTDDYWCSSGYCNPSRYECDTSDPAFNWLVPALIIGTTSFVILIAVFVIIMVNRQRRRAFGYYQNPYVVLPPNVPCSYQNSYPVGETAPPPYPGYAPTEVPRSYQG